jgi:hypothetical protein
MVGDGLDPQASGAQSTARMSRVRARAQVMGDGMEVTTDSASRSGHLT